MVDSLSRRLPPTKEEVIASIRAWYAFIKATYEEFSTPEAQQKYDDTFEGYNERFMREFDGDKRVVFLTERGRRLLEKRGWIIEGHTAADKEEETGTENF